MSWTNLIAAMARIIDSYDSQREVGSSNTHPGPENRRHNTTGIWCEVGIVILEYLNKKDEEVSRDYVSLEQIFYDNKEIFEQIDEDLSLNDILYVVNLFLTPIPLKFRVQSIKGTTQTALIEQARAGGDVRISKMGQFVCWMSGVVDEMLNIDLDVQRLARDLEDGRFNDFFRHCDGSIKIIIKSTREIYMHYEMPALSKMKEEFSRNKDRYLDVLKKTNANIIVVNDLLNSVHIKEKIELWIDITPGDHDIEFRLRSQLRRLRESVERYSRAFLNFIAHINEIGDHVIETVNFFEACKKSLQKDSLREDDLISLFILNGLWSPRNFCASISDFFRNVQIPVERRTSSLVLSSDQGINPDLIFFDNFLLEHRDYLIGKLSMGPLPLSQLLRDEIIMSEDISRFSSILGVYMNTDSLGLNGGKICVAFNDDRMIKYGKPMWQVKANDLQLVYLPAQSRGE